eukprot:6205630-Pleurochrysis_carterae.AAC.1
MAFVPVVLLITSPLYWSTNKSILMVFQYTYMQRQRSSLLSAARVCTLHSRHRHSDVAGRLSRLSKFHLTKYPVIETKTRPVGIALYGRSNHTSGVTPEAESSGIDAPTSGVVNILMIMR